MAWLIVAMRRYSFFIVLYPVGIGSEWWLMYKAANATVNPMGAGVFYFCLALYVPGEFTFTRNDCRCEKANG
jgi:hypothetical protein